MTEPTAPKGCLGQFASLLRSAPRPALLPPPMPFQVKEIGDWHLPSRVQGVEFVLSGRVAWQPLPDIAPHPDLESLALNSVFHRAAAVTSQGFPGYHVSVATRLTAELGEHLPEPTGRVRAHALGLSLSIADGALEQTQKYRQLLVAQEVWRLESALERERAAFFQEKVLRDTGSAAAWWLSRNPDRAQEPEVIADLDHWVRAAGGGTPGTATFAEAVSDLTGGLDASSRELFLSQLSRLLERYGLGLAGHAAGPRSANGGHAQPQ
ncbi:hypothetical protein JOF53_006928 [Crossiella equi]|uniref:Uncharacterized protein n=1 Tax=Crossiella equi TaxID=130796 RepID=A0ABS5ANR6_9PSEU|nr:hypothetical protein [Crossiella equi]MBP2478056.1 hypothetical protein [Crossiella equi]